MSADDKVGPVSLANELQDGIRDALAHIKAATLDPRSTLVDAVPDRVWAEWDQSEEVSSMGGDGS